MGMRRIVLGILLCLPWVAQAGSFEVNPVILVLSGSHTNDVVRVTNTGAQPVVVQAQLYAWSQVNGSNTYTDSHDLVMTPPIFTIPVGGMQLVRVGLRNPQGPAHELNYALFLAEVPPSKSQHMGLQIALRVGMPVFVEPSNDIESNLHWTVARAAGGELAVTASNTGTGHAEVKSFSLTREGNKTPLLQENGGYVLAGQSRTWTLKLPLSLAAGTALELAADTDGGMVSAQLVLP
jgi:fimbrial chaperone protein